MAGSGPMNGNNAAGNSDFTRKADLLAENVLAGLWATPAPMQTREGWTAAQIAAARAAEKAKGQNGNGFGLGLAAQATIWPTPSARDYRTPNREGFQKRGGMAKGEQLPNFVAHCFTPPARRTWTSGVPSSTWRPISRRLFRSAMSSLSPTVRRRWLRKGSWRTRRLNPSFVEWLMSWPPDHAACACSETGFTRWQRRMRGAVLQLPMALGPWIWQPPAPKPAPQQMTLWGDATPADPRPFRDTSSEAADA